MEDKTLQQGNYQKGSNSQQVVFKVVFSEILVGASTMISLQIKVVKK